MAYNNEQDISTFVTVDKMVAGVSVSKIDLEGQPDDGVPRVSTVSRTLQAYTASLNLEQRKKFDWLRERKG